MELKKSYKGFAVWMVGFTAVSIGVSFLPLQNEEILTRLVLNVCTIGIAVLALIIHQTESVYWYNGTTYEQAVEAGEERRKEFAMRHLKRFALLAVEFLIFSVIAQLLELPILVDVLVMTVALVGVAISTIPIKL